MQKGASVRLTEHGIRHIRSRIGEFDVNVIGRVESVGNTFHQVRLPGVMNNDKYGEYRYDWWLKGDEFTCVG